MEAEQLADPALLDATAQAALVRGGGISPVEAVEQAIGRIERLNPELNAVVIPPFEKARAEARAGPDGPFRGVPYLLKDVALVWEGDPTCQSIAGVKAAGYRADHDSFFVERMRRAGFVLIGKTSLDEIYAAGVDSLRVHGREIERWWEEHGWDLLLTPTTPARPAPLGQPGDGDPMTFTVPFNVSGPPAISLPLGEDGACLPIGAQLVAAYGREDVLPRVASQLETAMPWAVRRPPLSDSWMGKRTTFRPGGKMADEPNTEHERLALLVGKWKTEGWTREAPGTPAAKIEATDTYERLPGGAFLHRVDARVGDQKVEGAEIIGYDPARGSYVTQYFGSDGPAAYEAKLSEEDGTLLWAMRSESDRFTGTFSADRNTITGHWEQLQGSTWQPWMDITLTRQTK